ncbi:MAG: hypothetical protein O2955_19445 [Planctomycetota bacterium]|nr:hypothetical protein [Planctomycetota bacterium]MDA1214690.1 hypothetical protein [Planctomycetota bacterium]
MPHWVKRKSGVKGPFSKTQIEGFIETGRLPDGVLISEDPDGPWQPFTISHNDVAVEPDVDSSYESQEMGDEDSDATHTAGQNGDCPFPGSLFENILLGASSGNVDAKNEVSSDWKRIFGVTYVVSFVFVALSVIIMAFRADVPISQFSFLFLGLSLGAFVMTVSHYATHAALDLNVALLQSPIFRVSSVRHLHIVATPLVVGSVAAIYLAIFSLYSAIQFNAVSGSFIDSGPVRSSAATLVLAMSLSFVILRAILNPQQLGVLVDPKATAGETVLGIFAIFVRAPVHASPFGFRIGLTLVLIGTFSLLLLSLGVTSQLVADALPEAIVVGSFFMAWPVIAYVDCLLSLYFIESAQCVFSICRNVELMSNPAESD